MKLLVHFFAHLDCDSQEPLIIVDLDLHRVEVLSFIPPVGMTVEFDRDGAISRVKVEKVIYSVKHDEFYCECKFDPSPELDCYEKAEEWYKRHGWGPT